MSEVSYDTPSLYLYYNLRFARAFLVARANLVQCRWGLQSMEGTGFYYGRVSHEERWARRNKRVPLKLRLPASPCSRLSLRLSGGGAAQDDSRYSFVPLDEVG